MTDPYDLKAIRRMYNALMGIGAIDTSMYSPGWCIARAQDIANAALKEMNVEHTKLVQKALGIGK